MCEKNVVSFLFLIVRVFYVHGWNVCESKWKVYSVRELRKGIMWIGKDHTLVRNVRFRVEWGGNWQIAYQHESPDHSISAWDIVPRESPRIERVRDESWLRVHQARLVFTRSKKSCCSNDFLSILVRWCFDLQGVVQYFIIWKIASYDFLYIYFFLFIYLTNSLSFA